MRNGGGFYVYHEANNSFAEWPGYNEMIGLGWRKKDFGRAIVVRPDESIRIVRCEMILDLDEHGQPARLFASLVCVRTTAFCSAANWKIASPKSAMG